MPTIPKKPVVIVPKTTVTITAGAQVDVGGEINLVATGYTSLGFLGAWSAVIYCDLQFRYHFSDGTDYATGLDVISNGQTNRPRGTISRNTVGAGNVLPAKGSWLVKNRDTADRTLTYEIFGWYD